MKTALEKKYSINLNSVTEKDIIYFCRDALSVDSENKEMYEQEILELIKSKEYDWFAQDIDKNNILTYPVYNNAFSIVKYLLDNHKYNLNEYNERVSNSLLSCIMLTGEKMQDFIISKNIHSEYISDMIFRAYNMSDYVMPQYKETYLKKAQELMKFKSDFNKILGKFLKVDEFEKIKQTFYLFLEQHPLPIQEKKQYVSTILKNLQERKSGARLNRKYLDLGKWLQYHELNDKLVSKEISAEKKMKI